MRDKYPAAKLFGRFALYAILVTAAYIVNVCYTIISLPVLIGIAITVFFAMIITVLVKFGIYSSMNCIVREYCRNGLSKDFMHRYRIYLNSMIGDGYQERRIELAYLMAFSGEYVAALDELSHISIGAIHDNGCKAMYYAVSMYCNILFGNVAASEKLFAEGRMFIENETKKTGNPLLYTIEGIYFYHQDDFNRSTAMLNSAKINICNKRWRDKYADSAIKEYIFCDFNSIMLLLAADYIELERYSEAKKIADDIKRDAESIQYQYLRLRTFSECNDLVNRIKPSMKSHKNKHAYNNDPTENKVYSFSDGARLEKLNQTDKNGMPSLVMGRRDDSVIDINKPEIDSLEVAPKVTVNLDSVLMQQEAEERARREAEERERAEAEEKAREEAEKASAKKKTAKSKSGRKPAAKKDSKETTDEEKPKKTTRTRKKTPPTE